LVGHFRFQSCNKGSCEFKIKNKQDKFESALPFCCGEADHERKNGFCRKVEENSEILDWELKSTEI
jgi:hypothetical protein